MRLDSNEITRALRVFYQPGDVFEVRALDAVTQTGRGGYTGRPHVECGYFDYEHIGDVPSALEAMKSAKGVYVTLNPVWPDLLARCANRMKAADRGDTTLDSNVCFRRWLLVDCDVTHMVSGISSTDMEHDSAMEAARRIRDKLATAGWPEPVMLDTGNGASLLYRIDLECTEENDLGVAAVLDALQDFTTPEISIDVSVKNRARIFRLPGTMNCKGDDIPSRPHRMARLVAVPEQISAVGREEWMSVVSYGKKKSLKAAQTSAPMTVHTLDAFDADEWIRLHCPEAEPPVQCAGQRKWYLPCPWQAEHTGKQGRTDTYIGQFDSGAMYFKCSHCHCANRNWHDLCDLLEPGWRDARKADDSDVDLSCLLGEKKAEEPPAPADEEPFFKEEDSYFIPFPKELYNVPGIVKSVMELTLKHAPEPNRPLALGGALALMSIICSRKVVSSTNATPNIYLLLIEDSGNGKNFPRTVNKEILYAVGMDENISDRIASGAGLEDTISKGKALLWQNDEFQYLLADMGIIRKEDNNNSLSQYILTYYTEANSIVKTRSLAGRPGILVNRPHLVILGTTTPAEFFDALTERVLRNGLFARMNMLLGEGLRPPDLDREDSVLEIDDSLLEEIVKWRDFRPPGSGNMDVKPMIVQYTADAREFDRQLKMRQYERRKALENDSQEWKGTLWTRFREMANRYALIYACSIAPDPSVTVITIDAVKWGAAFVEWDIENRIKMIEHRYFRSEYEKQCRKVIDIMLKWHTDSRNVGKGMPSGVFNLKLGVFTPQQRADIVNGLKAQKRLLEVQNQGRGGGCKYYLPQYFGQNGNIDDKNAKKATISPADDKKNGEDRERE